VTHRYDEWPPEQARAHLVYRIVELPEPMVQA
jgi:hypothetical protein